jgi:hypothetical protein
MMDAVQSVFPALGRIGWVFLLLFGFLVLGCVVISLDYLVVWFLERKEEGRYRLYSLLTGIMLFQFPFLLLSFLVLRGCGMIGELSPWFLGACWGAMFQFLVRGWIRWKGGKPNFSLYWALKLYGGAAFYIGIAAWAAIIGFLNHPLPDSLNVGLAMICALAYGLFWVMNIVWEGGPMERLYIERFPNPLPRRNIGLFCLFKERDGK